MAGLLEVDNLTVSIEGTKILEDLSFVIEEGETVALFGPNGAGKSSLLAALLGFPRYRVEQGRILLRGEDITALPTDQRARRGMGVSFQHPPPLRGIRLRDMLGIVGGKGNGAERVERDRLAARLTMDAFLDREVNRGFSGGELKRSEILQLLVQGPLLALLDEPDSGVDLENIELIGREIERLVEGRGALLITHQGHILTWVTADRAMVLFEGRIGCTGKPATILQDIKDKGYAGCVACAGCRAR